MSTIRWLLVLGAASAAALVLLRGTWEINVMMGTIKASMFVVTGTVAAVAALVVTLTGAVLVTNWRDYPPRAHLWGAASLVISGVLLAMVAQDWIGRGMANPAKAAIALCTAIAFDLVIAAERSPGARHFDKLSWLARRILRRPEPAPITLANALQKPAGLPAGIDVWDSDGPPPGMTEAESRAFAAWCRQA